MRRARHLGRGGTLLGCDVAADREVAGVPPRAGPKAAVLVIASGANRVDEAKVAALLSEPIGRPMPRSCDRRPRYAIGGIPPWARDAGMPVLVDRTDGPTIRQSSTRPAARPNALFQIAPADLVRARRAATVADVALVAGFAADRRTTRRCK
jgi:prolyl-tRNA editing enzyme YbaK/EbsC (Cys-tRNA(Pro) deacylase)